MSKSKLRLKHNPRKGQQEKLSGVMRAQCATCPYRTDGKGYIEIQGLLSMRALTTATPICHSTGTSNVTSKDKKVTHRNLACRGARDLQLAYFKFIGFLDEATDHAWNEKCRQMGLPVVPTVTAEILRDWEDENKQYSP